MPSELILCGQTQILEEVGITDNQKPVANWTVVFAEHLLVCDWRV